MYKSREVVIKIGPSILNANLATLATECDHLMKCGADYLHLDVMDGHFVPNITFGHPVVKCLRRELGPGPFFDLHMMVSRPEQWINPMAESGANQYTFHIEATDRIEECIRKVKEAGMKVGLGIKPATDVSTVIPYINDVDMILVMTVEPGFGGQKFMVDMMDKVKLLRDRFPFLDIEVDGGVGSQTVHHCGAAGANMIVSGTAVTQAADKGQVIREMRSIMETQFPKSSSK